MMFDMEDGKIPQGIMDELKLKTIQWERMRDRSGLNKLTQKDRVAQIEMAHAELSHRFEHLRRSTSKVLIFVLAMLFIDALLRAITLFAR